MPVVVTRDKDGALHAFENRCAHRGSLLVLNERGEAKRHRLRLSQLELRPCGNLTGVAFRRGIGGKGGMPADAGPTPIGPRQLRVETLGGLVFGTLSAATPPLERLSRRRRSSRASAACMRAPVKLLGGYSQTLPSNWKLYMENVKDSYHASLLHTFFTTFRLNRLSQRGGIVVSDYGGNHVSYSMSAEAAARK